MKFIFASSEQGFINYIKKRKIAVMTHEIQAQQTGMQGFSLYLWRKTLRVDIPAELSDLSLYVTFLFVLLRLQ